MGKDEIACLLHDPPGDRFRHLDTVDGGGEDAAGVAGPLARGIETLGVEALEVVAPRDAQRGGGPRLDAGQEGVVHREPWDLPVEDRERLADRLDRVVGQAGAQIPQPYAGAI